jgi:hypothetical protein
MSQSMMWQRDHVRRLYESERASTVSFVEEEHTTEKHGKVKKCESGFRYLKGEDRRSSMFYVM